MRAKRWVFLVLALQIVGLLAGTLPVGVARVAAATDVTGEWYGRLTQGTGGTRPEFYFSLELQQTGSAVTGTSRIEVIESQGASYGVMNLEGSVAGGTLTFTETGFVTNDPEASTTWCLKMVTAHYMPIPGGQDTLNGDWTSPGCAPGQFTLTRAYSLKLSTQGGGSASATPAPNGPDARAYVPGTAVTITATSPGGGALFIGWTVNGQEAGYANPLVLTMNQKSVVVANFSIPPTFCDVNPGDLYAEAIRQLSARGIIRGSTGDNGQRCFGPDEATKRAQMAALIARPLGWDLENHGNTFTDRNGVDDNLWRNVGTLQFYEVAKGYKEETCVALRLTPPCYGPLDEVAYIQVIAFITRGMVEKGYWEYQADNGSAYPNVPLDSGHRVDLATYLHFVPGPLPGTNSTGEPWALYDQPALRKWFAEAEWRALSSYFGLNPVP